MDAAVYPQARSFRSSPTNCRMAFLAAEMRRNAGTRGLAGTQQNAEERAPRSGEIRNTALQRIQAGCSRLLEELLLVGIVWRRRYILYVAGAQIFGFVTPSADGCASLRNFLYVSSQGYTAAHVPNSLQRKSFIMCDLRDRRKFHDCFKRGQCAARAHFLCLRDKSLGAKVIWSNRTRPSRWRRIC